MVDQPPLGYHAGVVATSSTGAVGALSWALDQLLTHGPSWSVVPPLMFGIASCAGAYWSARKMRVELAIAEAKAAQERRHADEMHRIRCNRFRLQNGLDPVPRVETQGARP